MTDRLPLTVLTGFLGSGKTTLLQRLLQAGTGGKAGIIVNEFGEVGLDHRLLVHAPELLERVDGGCICCARRPDIGRALHTLVGKARSPLSGGIDHLILETTGLADPAPIVAEIGRDPWMRANVVLARVVCVFDAVSGRRSLERHEEARRQVAIADTVVVTKTDLSRAEPMEAIVADLRKIAPDVRIVDAQDPGFAPAGILMDRTPALGAASSWPEAAIPDGRPAPVPGGTASHAAAWSSFVVPMTERLDWPAFTVWLSALLHAHGARIVRVKGLLRTTAGRNALVLHGVQHVMHPPRHLGADEDDGTPGFLVFITQDIEKARIIASLDAFLHAARSIAPAAFTAVPVREAG